MKIYLNVKMVKNRLKFKYKTDSNFNIKVFVSIITI